MKPTCWDSQWCDTLTDYTLLYYYKRDKISILYPDGTEIDTNNASIITAFPYGRHRLFMLGIVCELNLPKELPDMEKMKRFTFGSYIWFPRARFELDFEFNDRNFS